MNTMKRKVALTVVLALGALSSASFTRLLNPKTTSPSNSWACGGCIVDTTSR